MGQGALTETRRWDLVESVEAALDRIYGALDLTDAGNGAKTKSSQGDLVTELDATLESRVRTQLEGLLPGSLVVGEETGGVLNDKPTWIIDPIDGTTNVVHGLPHAAVTVALTDHGRPVLGVVRDMFGGSTYVAVEGAGAFLLKPGYRRRQLFVSSTTDLSRALIGFGLPYDRDRTDAIFAAAKRVFRHCQDLRRRGSAALDIVAVAAGLLDAHIELDLRPWDVAAAGLVLTEAGGDITTWSRAPVDWRGTDNKESVAATNGTLHAELLNILGD